MQATRCPEDWGWGAGKRACPGAPASRPITAGQPVSFQKRSKARAVWQTVVGLESWSVAKQSKNIRLSKPNGSPALRRMGRLARKVWSSPHLVFGPEVASFAGMEVACPEP